MFVAAGDFVFLEMYRLLFSEAGSVPAYCGVSRLPVGAYIDNLSSLFWPQDVRLPTHLGDFVCSVLRVDLHVDKFYEGIRPLFLGMHLPSPPPASPCGSAPSAGRSMPT